VDENKLKKILQSSLDVSFNGLTIKEVRALETSQMNDDWTWKPFSYTLFITLNRGGCLDENNSKTINILDTVKFLESLTGFECCIDFN
jgi:hypothetical protein